MCPDWKNCTQSIGRQTVQFHFSAAMQICNTSIFIVAENLPLISVTEGVPFQVCFGLSMPPEGSDITVNIRDNLGANGKRDRVT